MACQPCTECTGKCLCDSCIGTPPSKVCVRFQSVNVPSGGDYSGPPEDTEVVLDLTCLCKNETDCNGEPTYTGDITDVVPEPFYSAYTVYVPGCPSCTFNYWDWRALAACPLNCSWFGEDDDFYYLWIWYELHTYRKSDGRLKRFELYGSIGGPGVGTGGLCYPYEYPCYNVNLFRSGAENWAYGTVTPGPNCSDGPTIPDGHPDPNGQCCQENPTTLSIDVTDNGGAPRTYTLTANKTGGCGDIATCLWKFYIGYADDGDCDGLDGWCWLPWYTASGDPNADPPCEVTFDCTHIPDDWQTIIDDTGAPGVCGPNLKFKAVLVTTDEGGCITSAETELECNACTAPTAELIVTELDDCQYELCAEISGGCDPGPPFIEYQLDYGACNYPEGCECADIGTEDCTPSDCGGTLGDGDCVTITINRSGKLRWRAWDKLCGCPGEWTEVDVTCLPCSCCDGSLAGAMIAVTGVTNCDYTGTPGRSCNCSVVNQTYDVPATTSCGGAQTFSGEITCNDGGGDIPIDWYLEWVIFCDEDGYWLQLGFNISNAPFGDFETVFLGEEMPACVDISECVTISNTDTGCGYCDIFDVTLCATFYA